MADTLANTIKKIRLKAGDSPASAAAKIGVSRPGYLKWEQGDTQNMKLGNLLSFCDAYNIPVEALLRGALVVGEGLSNCDQPKPITYQTNQPSARLEAAEPNPEIKGLIEGYTHADEGLRRAMLALARESIAVFEQRREKNS